MNNNLQIARIWQQDPVHANAIADIYICQNPEQIKKSGLLFVLVNIHNPRSDYDQFIGALIEKIENIYYFCPLEDSTKMLESTLSELNAWLPQNLPADKKILQNLDLLIGNYRDELINFATLGQWQGYILNNYKATDVIGTEKITINPIKIFQNVITGKVDQGFSLLLTGPSLLDYIALEKIRKIISTIPASSAAEQIKNMIAGVGPRVSFLGLIIKQPLAEQEINQARQSGSYSTQQYQQWNNQFNSKITKQSKESLDNLLATQKETQKIMTQPSSWQTLALIWVNTWQKISQSSLAPWSKKIGGKINSLLKILYHGFVNLLSNLSILLGNQLKNIKYFNFFRPALYFNIKNFKFTLRHLIVLIIIILIPILFILINSADQGLSQQQLTELQNNINAKSQEIESALIYGNRDRAKQIWQELMDLNKLLPTDQNNDSNVQGLRDQIVILTDRIWNIRNLEQPKIVWSQEQNQTTVKGISLNNNFLIAWLENNGYWRIDLQDGNNNKYFAYPANFAGWKINGYLPNGQPLIIDQNNNFYGWQNDSLNKITVTLSSGSRDITSLDSYNGRLYIFDQGNKQIYRYQQNNNSLGAASLWLRDNLELQNYQSMAIDGNLYLVKNDSIIVLNNGRSNRTMSLNIQPILSNSLKIFTKPDFINLYLLDQGNNKLIVLNKNGDLVNQYQSSSFNQLKDAIIIEKDKKAYLLNGQQILEMTIEKVK